MNNIFSFEEYLVEKNKKRTWDKLTITPSETPEDGTVEVKPNEGGVIDEDTKDDVSDILADDYQLLVSVTGKCNIGGFMDKVKKYIKYIGKMKNICNGLNDKPIIYRPTNHSSKFKPLSYKTYLISDEDEYNITPNIFSDIFYLTPDGSKNFGKGEVLLSSCYKNVNRILTKDAGGEPGDCGLYSNDNDKKPTRYIEVKSAKTRFYNASTIKRKFDYFIDEIWSNYNNIDISVTNDVDIHPDIQNILFKNCIGGIVKYLQSQLKPSEYTHDIDNDVISKTEEDDIETNIPKKGTENLSLVFFCDDPTSNKLDNGSIYYYDVDVKEDAKLTLTNFLKKIKKVELTISKKGGKGTKGKLPNEIYREIEPKSRGRQFDNPNHIKEDKKLNKEYLYELCKYYPTSLVSISTDGENGTIHITI